MQEQIEFRKLRELGEVINDTFLFIRQNFKPLLRVFIYLCGFFMLATMILAIFQQIQMQDTIRSIQTNKSNPFSFDRYTEVFSVSYFLVILFSMANYAAIETTVLCYIILYIKNGNESPTLEQVWAYFKYYYFRLLLSTIPLVLLMIIGFALCLIPGIYIFPAISLIFPIMIFENSTLGYGFGRSFNLLKDHWWVTAGTMLIIWIITYATMSLAAMPAFFIGIVKGFSAGSVTLSTTVIIITTVIQYVCQVFMILPIIGASLCYFNLVEHKENTGLIGRVKQMGHEENRFNGPEEY